MANPQGFFERQSVSSKVKSNIVCNYFAAWSRIMTTSAKKNRIGFVDLYCGPGRYDDGALTSASRIIKEVSESQSIWPKLSVLLNDRDPQKSEAMRQTLEALSLPEALFNSVEITSQDVSAEDKFDLSRYFQIPTLFYFDPWGYRGLTSGLISKALKGWGSECIIFLNYNRLNAAIDHRDVATHVTKLLGHGSSDELQVDMKGLSPSEREIRFIEHVDLAFKRAGAKHVLGFRFGRSDQNRTSHYLMFATKNPIGLRIMSDIMGRESDKVDGFPMFEFNPKSNSQQPLQLGLFRDQVISAVESLIIEVLSDGPVTVYDLIDLVLIRNIGIPVDPITIREALDSMEQKGDIEFDIPRDDRHSVHGKVTFGASRLVSLAKGPRNGSQI